MNSMPQIPPVQAALHIDLAVRQSLVEMLGSQTFATLVEQFSAELAQAASDLAACAADKQGEAVAQLAHKVAGSAAVLGAEGARAYLVEIEHLARDGDFGTCIPMIEALPALKDQIVQALLSGVA